MKKITFYLVIFTLFSNCTTQKHINSDMKWNYKNFRASQKSFNSSDGKIKYIDKGEGEVVLLMHGIPASAWLYRKMIDGLVDGGYRVIAPDMLGFGNSDNPKGYEIYSQAAHAKRVLELMNSLQIKSWTHVMHDAGGLWSWEIMKKSPESIKKLVVLNTIIYEEGFNPPVKMKKGAFAKFSMWLYRNGVTTNILLNQLFKNGLKNKKLAKNEVEGYKLPLREGKTKAMYYFFTQTCNDFPDYNSIIENLNIPVLLIWGKHDEMLEWEPQKEKVIKGLKIQAENIHILDAKHFIQEEMPDRIDSLILGFVANKEK